MNVVESSTVRARLDRARVRCLGRVLVPLAVLWLASPAAATVIRLTSGGLIEAQAWREVGDDLEVILEGGTLRVPKADVLRIDGPPPRPVASPVPPPAARPIAPPVAKAVPTPPAPPVVPPGPVSIAKAAPAAPSPPAPSVVPPGAGSIAKAAPAAPSPPAPSMVPPGAVSIAKAPPTAQSPPLASMVPPGPVFAAKAAPTPSLRPVPAVAPPPPPIAAAPRPAPVMLAIPAPAIQPIPGPVAKAAPSAPPVPRPTPATAPPAPLIAVAPVPSRIPTATADSRTVDEWQRDLASPAVEVRRRAASALAQLAENDADAIAPLLTPALRDADAQVRIAAALALGAHGREPQAVTAVLVSTLGATDVTRRRTGQPGPRDDGARGEGRGAGAAPRVRERPGCDGPSERRDGAPSDRPGGRGGRPGPDERPPAQGPRGASRRGDAARRSRERRAGDPKGRHRAAPEPGARVEFRRARRRRWETRGPCFGPGCSGRAG